MPYKLTIVPDGAGGYLGRLESGDGDLWARLVERVGGLFAGRALHDGLSWARGLHANDGP